MKVLILGGGITGMSAALYAADYGHEVTLIERNNELGGLLRPIAQDGYKFDRSGHWLWGGSEATLGFLESYVELREVCRSAAMFIEGRYVPYPVQHHYGLLVEDKDKLSVIEELAFVGGRNIVTFDDLVRAHGFHIGNVLKEHNERYLRYPLDSIPAYGKQRTPDLDYLAMIRGVLRGNPNGVVGYNSVFYTVVGGMGNLIDALVEDVLGHAEIDVWTKTQVTSIEALPSYDVLISTIPYLSLCSALYTGTYLKFGARWLNAVCVNVGGTTSVPSKYQWVYLPASYAPAHRIGFYSNVYEPEAGYAPPGKASMYIDVNVRSNERLPTIEEILRPFLDWGMILDIDTVQRVDIEYAYSVDAFVGSTELANFELVKSVIEQLEKQGIYSIGHFGAWGGFKGTMESVDDAIGAVIRATERFRS